MLSINELITEVAERHEDEIREAIMARLEYEFDADLIAENIVEKIDLTELLAEAITLPF